MPQFPQLMPIKQAERCDKKAILRFYKSQHYSARYLGQDLVYTFQTPSTLIAAVMVSQIQLGSEVSFLHALVVDKNHQGLGLASQLLHHALTKHAPLVCFAAAELAPLYASVKMQMLSNEQIKTLLPQHLLARFNAYLLKTPKLKVFYHD